METGPRFRVSSERLEERRIQHPRIARPAHKPLHHGHSCEADCDLCFSFFFLFNLSSFFLFLFISIKTVPGPASEMSNGSCLRSPTASCILSLLSMKCCQPPIILTFRESTTLGRYGLPEKIRHSNKTLKDLLI